MLRTHDKGIIATKPNLDDAKQLTALQPTHTFPNQRKTHQISSTSIHVHLTFINKESHLIRYFPLPRQFQNITW